MAKFIGNLKTIKIDNDGKVSLTYEVQLNPNAKNEMLPLLEAMSEPLTLQVSDPLTARMVSFFTVLRTLKIDQDRANFSIEFMASDFVSLFELIQMQTSALVFEFKQGKPVAAHKEAA